MVKDGLVRIEAGRPVIQARDTGGPGMVAAWREVVLTNRVSMR